MEVVGDEKEEIDMVRENTEDNVEEKEENERGNEMVVEDVDDGLGDAPNIIGMDPNKEYLIVSYHYLPECLYDGDREKGNWLAWPELGLNATTEKIKELLKSEEPKNILVLAYQKFVPTTNVSTLEKHMNEVSNMALGSIHNLAIGNIYYQPQFERIWDRKTTLNQHIRLLNLNSGLSPCNIHKRFLVSFNKGRVHYVRPNLFAEYVKGTGVGENLSYAGYARIMETGFKYLYNAFEPMERPVSKAIAAEVEPPPLFLTPGYKNIEGMMKHIKEAGLRQPSRPKGNEEATKSQDRGRPVSRGRGNSFRGRGSSRRGGQSRGGSSRGGASRGGASRGGASRGGSSRGGASRVEPKRREKVKDNGLVWTEEDDMSGEELREHRMRKLEKRRLGPDADELADRLNELRLKGIKNDQRNRQKENNMSKKIKTLEKDCNDKDKTIKDLRYKLRDGRDNDKKVRDLKESVKDKERKLRSLRNDLEDAEQELKEYRSAYEKICDEMDNKRRRRY